MNSSAQLSSTKLALGITNLVCLCFCATVEPTATALLCTALTLRCKGLDSWMA
ncbi:hypothetical protein Mapa_012264 [Marchantia paleacea]|nr:hypothetical protein Mapa_012264 [Marchantia paleacea]